MLHRLLLHYEHLSPDQTRAAVAYAFTWLDGHPAHEECVSVLGPLLRMPALSSAQLRHAVHLGTTALLERPDDNKLMAVMLSQPEGLTAEQAAAIADVGLEWLACHGGEGTAPGARLYVWTDAADSRFASRASQSNLKGAVEAAVCRNLTGEFNSDKSWNYTRWAVAVHDAYTSTRQFVGSGTCSP